MTSLADDLFEEFGLPVLEEHCGEADAAQLTTRGGDESGPFDVLLDHVGTERSDEDSGGVLLETLVVRFPKDDALPFWSGNNLTGLVVSIGGKDWALDTVLGLSDAIATVKLVRRATTEVSRPGFRKQ